MKIGIYGGTFDPPHLGHFLAAQSAVKALQLDRLLLIPAAQPPHKALGPDSAASGDRLAMTELMADGLNLESGKRELCAADPRELDRAGKSYTVDTLEEIRAQYPEDELWLLMGSDMFLTFDTWRSPARICALAGLAAFSRENGDSADMEAQAQRLRKTMGAAVRLVPLPEVTVQSSTGLRAALKVDRSRARDALWCQVYGYILLNGLYGVNADFRHLSDEDLRCASWSMVKAKRIPHIRGTEGEAVRLALRWGADPELARRAAILHDCTKYLDLDAQLKLCEKYDIVLDTLERDTVKLLHSKTGAAVARHIFGVPDEIYWAIYWHTTGKADMTILQKVLYLADYIEPSREDFAGLAELRALAYKDIDAALLLGCELTIADMKERGHLVHHNTNEARAFLKGRIK